jgi:hypothetical protein
MRIAYLFALLIPQMAFAKEIPCPLTQEGVIVADGLLDDWQGQARTELGNADAGLRVYCHYSDKRLYLAIDVRDERILGTAKRLQTSEDHAIVKFTSVGMVAFPGNPDADVSAETSWSDKKPHKNVKAVVALQQQGWAIEMALPLAEVPGWEKGISGIPFGVELRDADMSSERKIQTTLTLDAVLSFQEADALLTGFLGDFRLKRSDLKVDKTVELDGSPGTERVVAGGKVVAMLKDGYAYVEVAGEARDVLEVRVLDLAGAGKTSVLVRSRERGGGGSREVLAVWSFVGDRFQRTFAHEIGKEYGGKKLTNNWTLRPRKGKKAKGQEIVITPGTSTFTQAEWNETPAEDMQPIMLPWNEKKESIWWIENDQVFGG